MDNIRLIDILSELLREKSVPQPYDRSNARPMSKTQIDRRDTIGNAMLNEPATVKYFKKKFGDEWIDYIWAVATTKALGGE